jgi:hypothetical protein
LVGARHGEMPSESSAQGDRSAGATVPRRAYPTTFREDRDEDHRAAARRF